MPCSRTGVTARTISSSENDKKSCWLCSALASASALTSVAAVSSIAMVSTFLAAPDDRRSVPSLVIFPESYLVKQQGTRFTELLLPGSTLCTYTVVKKLSGAHLLSPTDRLLPGMSNAAALELARTNADAANAMLVLSCILHCISGWQVGVLGRTFYYLCPTTGTGTQLT